MASGVAGRAVSPDTTRALWAGIRHLGEQSAAATAEALGPRLPAAAGSDWSDSLEGRLAAAVEAGLVSSSVGGDGGVPVFTIPRLREPDSGEPEHDWYCFECHSGNGASGNVVGCSTCFRVYHPLCLNMPELEGAEFSCPVCVSVEKPTSLDGATLRESLDSILMSVFKEGGSALGESQLGSSLPRDEYQSLVARDVDLAAMRTKLETQRYPTPRHFFADFQLLVHNVALTHGKEAELTRAAQGLLVSVRNQVDGLEEADIEPGHNSAMEVDGRTTTTLKPANPRVPGLEDEGGWAIDDRFKKMLMDLQRYWLTEYQQSREKLLVELTEKLHSEFVSDQAKIRTELLTQFKDELDTTKLELEQKYKDNVKTEMAKLTERQRKEMSSVKKKQWCWQCEAEAIYHCCWNTAYCSVECQQAHWPTHRKYCRRKKAPGAPKDP